MEKKNTIQSGDVMQYIQNLVSENDALKKELADMKRNCKNAAYQQAEISAKLKVLSEQLTTIAQTNNGGPLNQFDAMRAPSLDSVPCAKPAKELTDAQRAAYEKRKRETAERKRKEAKSEAIKAAWTPERRAQQADRMKEQQRLKKQAESNNETNE